MEEHHHGKATGNLEQLPAELILVVLCQLDELVTLDSLIRASPTASRVFNAYAVKVTETILRHEFIHIRIMFRYLALLRSGTFPQMGLSGFKKRVIRQAMRYNTRIHSSRSGFVPKHLDEDTEAAVIRSVLATTRHIKCVALDCLNFYLARFRTLQPEHPVDPKFEFLKPRFAAETEGYIPPWQSRPETVKVEVRDVGPPSWIEEQRATRAFWRLQLIYDLKLAVARGTLVWKDSDVAWLQQNAVVSRPMDRENPNAPGITLWRARYEPHLLSNPGCRYYTDFYNSFRTHRRPEDSPEAPPEYDEIMSAIDYVSEAYGQAAADSLANARSCLAKVGGPREVHRPWPAPAWPADPDQAFKTLVSASNGVRRYYYSKYFRWRVYSPLPFVGFDTFGHYGFAFWSTERMRAYGLAAVSGTSRNVARVDYAWQSILSPGDIARVERESREYFTVHRS
jgi:hypothetical protein